MKTLYLSGPISNSNQYTAIFANAEKVLQECGYTVINPLRLDHHNAVQWEDYVRVDLHALTSSNIDGLALLPLSAHSRGVAVELMVADAIGIPSLSIDAWVTAASGKEET